MRIENFTMHTGPDWKDFVHKFNFEQKHAQMYQKSNWNDFESSFLIFGLLLFS